MRTWNGSRAYNPPKLLKIRLLAPNLAPTSFKVNKSLCPETHSKIFNRRASEAEKPIILSGYILTAMRISAVTIVILLCFLTSPRLGHGEDHHEVHIDLENSGERVKNFWYSTGKMEIDYYEHE